MGNFIATRLKIGFFFLNEVWHENGRTCPNAGPKYRLSAPSFCSRLSETSIGHTAERGRMRGGANELRLACEERERGISSDTRVRHARPAPGGPAAQRVTRKVPQKRTKRRHESRGAGWRCKQDSSGRCVTRASWHGDLFMQGRKNSAGWSPEIGNMCDVTELILSRF